jgi:hypothetical protein
LELTTLVYFPTRVPTLKDLPKIRILIIFVVNTLLIFKKIL